MNDGDLAGLTLARAARLIKTRKLSPVELTKACLARIERLQPTVPSEIPIRHRKLDVVAKRDGFFGSTVCGPAA